MQDVPTSSLKKPPIARGHWLYGSAFQIFSDMLRYIGEYDKDFEGIFGARPHIRSVYFITKPEFAKHILQDNNRNYHKSFGYDILKILLGNGLLTSEGDFWIKQRRLIQPAFHRKRLEGLIDVMTDSTNNMLDRWDSRFVKGQHFDLLKEMMFITVDIVSRALFTSIVQDKVDVIYRDLGIANEGAMKKIRNPFNLPPWVPTPLHRKILKSVDNLKAIVQEMIDKRRGNMGHHDDLLEMLIAVQDEDTGEQMTDEQLLDEVMTIFLAGHETTANAMAWTWYLLLQHPDKLQKLKSEVHSVLGDRKPALEDLSKLEYTKQILQESMRLYPPAWIIGRYSLEQDQLGEYLIEPGSNLLVSTYHIQRDPKIWDDAEAFIPERFANDALKQMPKYSYFPFGGGPRLCIGENFAMQEMLVLLSMMVARFDLELQEGFVAKEDPLITLRAKDGIMVSLK